MVTDIRYKIFDLMKEYGDMLQVQERTRKEVLEKKNDGTIFFLEHNEVYTVGIRGKENHFLNLSHENGKTPAVYKVRRGGEVTWHGPGQLIIYPVINFRKAKFRSIREFVNFFGESISISLRDFCGIKKAVWLEDTPGVWVDDRKIAFVGFHFSKFVPIHGFSVNLNPDMSHFKTIIPCGIPGCKITSVKHETEKEFSIKEMSENILSILKEKIPDIYEDRMEEQ